MRAAASLSYGHRHNGRAFLYAFDLIELNGDDLRRDPLEARKATLASVLAKAGPGIRFNEHIEGDGPTIFAHACKLGLEGIVSKRLGSRYRSGRSKDWLKLKNPAAPAVIFPQRLALPFPPPLLLSLTRAAATICGSKFSECRSTIASPTIRCGDVRHLSARQTGSWLQCDDLSTND